MFVILAGTYYYPTKLTYFCVHFYGCRMHKLLLARDTLVQQPFEYVVI